MIKRSDFIKRFIAGTTSILIPTSIIKSEDYINKPKLFSFEDLFIVHSGNENLLYPKKESDVYKMIEQCIIGRLHPLKPCTYLPVHHLSISIKDFYSMEDFMPLKYYFECVYSVGQKYTLESYGVFYRFIKDKPDRAHLDTFATY